MSLGPALVIMAKKPAVGQAKTRLCPPLTLAAAAALYEAMLQDTIALAAALQDVRLAIAVTPPDELDYFRLISPPHTLLLPISGTDIGDCLDQVFTHLLALGYTSVLALNSDGPTLPAIHLRSAPALLETADVVLGPGEDGGYYLIGLKRPQPELFRDITWSTHKVAEQTLARARSLGLSVATLPAWHDVDTADDLALLQAELALLPQEAVAHTRRFFLDRAS